MFQYINHLLKGIGLPYVLNRFIALFAVAFEQYSLFFYSSTLSREVSLAYFMAVKAK